MEVKHSLIDTINSITGDEKSVYLWVHLPFFKVTHRDQASGFQKSQGLAGSLSLQVISMVLVSIGVYARLMKHAGELQVSLCRPTTLARPLPLLLPSAL